MSQTGSSIKNFDYTGMSPEQIVQKYEKVLESREKQLAEISNENSNINDKVIFYSQKFSLLEEENNKLKEKLIKKEQILEQELNTKEVMFLRLEKKESEVENLKKEFERLIELAKKNNLEIPENIIEKEEKNTIKENSNQFNFRDKLKNITTTAGNNLKNITAKTGDNIKKFNFFEFFSKSEKK